MKHRLAVPYPHEFDGQWTALTEFLHRAAWRLCEYRVDTRRLGPALLMLDITPVWQPHAIELRVISGTTLIYDDIEQSLGVTMLAEPRDAVPPQPQDAKPLSFVDRYADPSLFQEDKPRRSRHGERR